MLLRWILAPTQLMSFCQTRNNTSNFLNVFRRPVRSLFKTGKILMFFYTKVIVIFHHCICFIALLKQ